jgi:hypothetical protein
MRNVAVLPPVKNELHAALLNLTAFKNFSTDDLIAMARTLPGGTKVHIPNRLTAIVLLLGTAPVHLIGTGSVAFQEQV